MKLNFRIDWGYQYLYSRRLYHPTYIWDGSLSCENGTIEETYQLAYPYAFYGIGHTAKETRLDAPVWESRTKRGMSGCRFVADTEDNCTFCLKTASGDFTFTADDIREKGRIEFPVGPKYLGCFVTVTLTGYLWFRPEEFPGASIYEADSFGLEVHDHARMTLAWLEPENTAKFKYTVPETDADSSETVIHVIGMGVPAYNAEKEGQIDAEIPFEVLCDGKVVGEFKRYYRRHDFTMQILEDEWVRVSVAPGEHLFELKNKHSEANLGISRIVVQQSTHCHGQLSIPEWALTGEKLVGKVWAEREDKIEVVNGKKTYSVDCVPGWNEFEFAVSEAGMKTLSTSRHEAEIEVFDCEEEKNPVTVGYDMTVVPHDDNGFMDWLLDYTARTRLGNYVVFRSFNGDVDDALLERWGEFCRTHGIHVSACNNYLSGALAKGAGDMLHDFGLHEYPGLCYAADPQEPYCSKDMKEASEHFMDHLKLEIDKAHTVCDVTAFGDASGGIRYAFLAGADFVRAETMVGPTMPLLSQARPASEALADGRWGVHIAIQHSIQPYRDTHLGQYFLCMLQPWAMGAETIYEEDSLFCLFKEERQAWDDALTKGKRDMTRAFFKFAKTHPRRGKNVRNIAFIEGRYAAPFNGFICDCEQDPHYAVWGAFGKAAEEWGHCQPEKCRQILDVLQPGASTHPLLQKHDKRRFYFSGTPYGDFDCVPVEADSEYMKGYKLLLNLGWNTLISEDYGKLCEFVEEGGVLLTGLPQFSTHVEREFLRDMEDLSLMNGGDLTELCGIRVNGAGDVYSGQWNCKGRDRVEEPELSALPSDCPCEDGAPRLADITLTTAEVVAWDSATGKPMLVKNKVGAGEVYTFTAWAYPGHEQFMRFSATWVEQLAKATLPDTYVEDESGEVFWTRWVDGDTERIMLLNTDWSKPGNEKAVTLVAGGARHALSVKEQTVLIAEVKDGKVTAEAYTL